MTEYYMIIQTGCQWDLLNICIFSEKGLPLQKNLLKLESEDFFH